MNRKKSDYGDDWINYGMSSRRFGFLESLKLYHNEMFLIWTDIIIKLAFKERVIRCLLLYLSHTPVFDLYLKYLGIYCSYCYPYFSFELYQNTFSSKNQWCLIPEMCNLETNFTFPHIHTYYRKISVFSKISPIEEAFTDTLLPNSNSVKILKDLKFENSLLNLLSTIIFISSV